MERGWVVRFAGLLALVGVVAAGAAWLRGPSASHDPVEVPEGPVPVVVCELQGPRVGRATVVEPDGARVAEVRGTTLTFVSGAEVGEGTLKVAGYDDVPLRWRDGRCDAVVVLVPEVTEPRAAAVSSTRGVAVGWRCGASRGRATLDLGGTFGFTGPAGPCDVRIERTFGPWSLVGTWQPFDPARTYDPPRVEGLAVATEPTAVGLRVTEVEPGGLGDLAGLEVGDVLVTVGGESALRVGSDALEEHGHGAVVELERGGKAQRVVVP